MFASFYFNEYFSTIAEWKTLSSVVKNIQYLVISFDWFSLLDMPINFAGIGVLFESNCIAETDTEDLWL